MSAARPRVGLFVTCLVDFHRPNVGFAAISLLPKAGCDVEMPRTQTSCGQPAYNSGNREASRQIAENLLTAFAAYDHVVAPSSSCAGKLSRHLPHLFDDDPNLPVKANALAAKTYELTAFLHDVLKFTPVLPALPVTATYHDSCAGLRELGVKTQPRAFRSGMSRKYWRACARRRRRSALPRRIRRGGISQPLAGRQANGVKPSDMAKLA